MKEKMMFIVIIGSLINLAFSPAFAVTEPLVESDALQTVNFKQKENTTNSIEDSEITSGTNEINKEDEQKTRDSAMNLQENSQTSSDSVNNISEHLEEEQNIILPNLQESVSTKNQTTSEFIEGIKTLAKKIAFDNDLYASVMIAQAILESASGKSSLSIAPNYNLFGIKGDFKGATVRMKTQEDDGTGELFTIDSKFRKYPSYKEALEDYADLLKNGLVGNPFFYKGTWKSETQNCQEASAFLTGRYATDIQYAEKLNQLIDVYELTSYDENQHEEIIKTKEVNRIVGNKGNKHVLKDIEIKNVKKLLNCTLRERSLQNSKAEFRKYFNEINDYFVTVLTWIRN